MEFPVFKDNFSRQSAIYAKYRPGYPKELFVFLASLTGAHQLVWDCGTGNGQAAVALTEYYDNVIATDPSAQQVSNAMHHSHIQYRVEKAEESSLPDNSADMVTIATALHWFDTGSFYKEVKRVLKPKGVIAAWAANTPFINSQVDKVINYLHEDILGDYWLAENRMVDNMYAALDFPFNLIDTPAFVSEKQMNFADTIGYLNTWSAVQRYIQMHQRNPVDMIEQELAIAWGNLQEEKTLIWNLVMKVGRI